MKKKLIIGLLAIGCAQAEPYVGFKAGFSALKTNPTLKGTENQKEHHVKLLDMKLKAFDLGLLLGYNRALNKTVSLFSEVDYEFSFKTVKKDNMSVYPDVELFDDENLAIRKKHAIGFMPGVRYNLSDTYYALCGVRVGFTQYEGKASSNDFDWDSDDVDAIIQTTPVTERKFLLSFEPTFGLGFNMTDKLSARLTVGHVMGKNKQIIKNYAIPQEIEAGINKGISVKPRGWNIRLGFVQSF